MDALVRPYMYKDVQGLKMAATMHVLAFKRQYFTYSIEFYMSEDSVLPQLCSSNTAQKCLAVKIEFRHLFLLIPA